MDPPESDTSEDTEPDNRRRMSRPPRRSPIPPEGALDEKGRNKSAAEESLEAAITEFNESISDMQIPQTPKTLEYYTSSLAQVVPGNVVAKKQMFSTTTPSQTASPESLPFRDITLGVQRANREEIRTRRENLKLNDQNFNKRLSGDTIKTKPITIATARFYDRSQSCGPLSSDVSSSSTPEHTRMRSETNVSLTSPRPWSPPNTYKSRFSTKVSSPAIDIEGRDSRKRTPPLKLSIDSQESKEADDSGSSRADQLSPLPTIPASPTSRGMNSLPGRGKRKQQPGADVSIPLAVRGLDLAASRERKHSVSRKEDLQVIVSLMESELEQEREEKEKLANELQKTKLEKERLFEQSQAAAKQLRKFTALFLESTPAELEKARQKFAASKTS